MVYVWEDQTVIMFIIAQGELNISKVQNASLEGMCRCR
jgi:hypothetical protein